MTDVITTRSPKHTRTICYTDSLHARREVLDLDDFSAYSGVFDAQDGTLVVYTLDGTKEIVFRRQHNEGSDFLKLSTCNILVALRVFPNLTTAMEETFDSGTPGEEPIVHSFCFAKTGAGTTVVLTD